MKRYRRTFYFSCVLFLLVGCLPRSDLAGTTATTMPAPSETLITHLTPSPTQASGSSTGTVTSISVPQAKPGDSFSPSISADGRYIVFVSRAGDLVEGDSNQCRGPNGDLYNCADVYVYDRQTAALEWVSIASDGTPANGNSNAPKISADGRWVVFRSEASNLVKGKANRDWSIFVRDLQTGTTELVSASGVGPSISEDGRFIAFNALSNGWNVFVHDRLTGQTERVSLAYDERSPDGDSLAAQISADGKWVAFWSWAGNLVADDTQVCRRHEENYSCGDVFLYERDTGQIKRITVSEPYGLGMGSYRLSLSSDGRWLAFSDSIHDRQTDVVETLCRVGEKCAAGILSADGQWVAYRIGAEVFVYDRLTGDTKLASVSSNGTRGNGEVIDYAFSFEGESFEPGFSLSAHGRWVAFASTASNLAAGDVQECSEPFFGPAIVMTSLCTTLKLA